MEVLTPYGLRVRCLPEVDSTNERLAQLAAAGAPSGTLLAAERQTKGRGRRGRSWLSVPGASLTFSLLWRFERPTAQLTGLSLAVGVALVRALHALGATGLGLKWPNDVLYGEAKLAGILIELSGDLLGPVAAIIGIGLNIRACPWLKEQLTIRMADLETACARRLNRNAVLSTVARELVNAMDTYSRYGFTPYRQPWLAYHAWHDRTVSVFNPDGSQLTGRIVGIDAEGALLLDTGTGIRPVLSGDVSLRKG